ncbi:MAG: hypothetical protein QM610_01045 [Chitinophagaceae bacterium]
MKKSISLLLILIGLYANGQTLEEVNSFYADIHISDSLYKVKNYEASLKLKERQYNWLLSINQLRKAPRFYIIPYDMLCEYSLTNQLDKAFHLLSELLKEKKFNYLESIYTDSDLENLRSDSRWEKYDKAINASIALKTQKLDSSLLTEFLSIREADQKPRFQYMDTIKKYGAKSEQAQRLVKDILFKDSLNLNRLTSILDKGWPPIEIIGENAEQTIYLVIQHAPLPVQEKYFSAMEIATQKGFVQPSDLAYLKDRILWRQHKLQIYGSQVKANAQGKALYPYPMEDPGNINLRRFKVGLYSMEEYMNKMHGTWDVKEYEKILPTLIIDLHKQSK